MKRVHRVVQSLLGVKGASIEGIREVRSHPVALEQCGRLFASHPSWERTVVDDTAGAVREIVAQNDPSRRCDRLANGGKPLRRGSAGRSRPR